MGCCFRFRLLRGLDLLLVDLFCISCGCGMWYLITLWLSAMCLIDAAGVNSVVDLVDVTVCVRIAVLLCDCCLIVFWWLLMVGGVYDYVSFVVVFAL